MGMAAAYRPGARGAPPAAAGSGRAGPRGCHRRRRARAGRGHAPLRPALLADPLPVGHWGRGAWWPAEGPPSDGPEARRGLRMRTGECGLYCTSRARHRTQRRQNQGGNGPLPPTRSRRKPPFSGVAGELGAGVDTAGRTHEGVRLGQLLNFWFFSSQQNPFKSHCGSLALRLAPLDVHEIECLSCPHAI